MKDALSKTEEKLNMRNLLFTIRYDGSTFHGWQVQKNAITVQEVFQKAVREIIGVCPDIKGCSRTDSGVHANMFCISMLTTHTIPCERFVTAMNSHLPDSVAVLDIKEVPLDFHARYSSLGKRYVYKVHNSAIKDPFLKDRALRYRRAIDVELLNKAAQSFVGSHDFTTFCTLDKREKGDFTRTISEFSVSRKGDMVYFSVTADGFLYNMVRIMVGTLLYINENPCEWDKISEMFEKMNRDAAGPTAPAQGLYLDKVFYKM